jgi:CRP/FNR family transcriptional regulator, cyclic AMP receptor protein
MGTKLEDKRVFLVVSPDHERQTQFRFFVQKHINHATVFHAADGHEAILKIESATPDVLITDYALPRVTGLELTDHLLKNKKYDDVQVIIASRLPDTEHFVDEVVTGRVQFYIDDKNETRFTSCVSRALNRLTNSSSSDYRLVFLTEGDQLIKEGEPGNSVFIVKKGSLQAFRNDKLLGEIEPGEFVGEMSHINHEPRNATVKATSDCELIEIPFTTLDYVLFSKPSWAKALAATLSKRLKRTNEKIATN